MLQISVLRINILNVVLIIITYSTIQVKILTAVKRLSDASDHVVECAKACASNSTERDSWEQVEWDRMGALRIASANIRNNFGRNPDNQWQLLFDSKTESDDVPIYANRYGMIHHDSDDDLVAQHLL